MIAAVPLSIVEQAITWAEEGARVVLVTLVAIEGSSSRALGAQMAVTHDGRAIGSFSGGCIEDAIVGEAREVLDAGQGRVVRYGIGSPYIDVRLPCGGGIDLMFTPSPSLDVLRGVRDRLHARQRVTLMIAPDGVGEQGPGFALALSPPLRVLAFGHGEDFTALVQLAHHFGALVEAFSPMERDVDLLQGKGLCATRLTHLTQVPEVVGDDWTAAVFLFHDRDWEEVLLPHVLSRPAFFYGAVGSRRTHAARLERLRAQGVEEETAARIKGPVGLIAATRDPATLAMSVLAEVVEAYVKV